MERVQDEVLMFRCELEYDLNTAGGCTKKISICILHELARNRASLARVVIRSTEVVEYGVGPRRSELVNDTALVRSSSRGCAIEVSVAALNWREAWISAICAFRTRTECVQQFELPGWADLEDRAGIRLSRYRCRAVEIPIAGQGDPVGGHAVIAWRRGTERVEGCELSAKRHLEKSSETSAGSVGASRCRSIQISVASESRGGVGIFPVGAVGLRAKTVNRADLSAGRHPENVTATVSPSAVSAVKVSVRCLDPSCGGPQIASELRDEGHGLCLGAHRQAEGEGCACECETKRGESL